MKLKSQRFPQFACLLIVTLSQAVMAQGSQPAQTQPEVRQTQITFKQGKLIEAAFIKITPGMESRLNAEYFSKVMPIAST